MERWHQGWGRTLGCTKTHLNQGTRLQHWTTERQGVEQDPDITWAQRPLPPTAHSPLPPLFLQETRMQRNQRQRERGKGKCTFGAGFDPPVGTQQFPAETQHTHITDGLSETSVQGKRQQKPLPTPSSHEYSCWSQIPFTTMPRVTLAR